MRLFTKVVTTGNEARLERSLLTRKPTELAAGIYLRILWDFSCLLLQFGFQDLWHSALYRLARVRRNLSPWWVQFLECFEMALCLLTLSVFTPNMALAILRFSCGVYSTSAFDALSLSPSLSLSPPVRRFSQEIREVPSTAC